jgi:hypothetical protein
MEESLKNSGTDKLVRSAVSGSYDSKKCDKCDV